VGETVHPRVLVVDDDRETRASLRRGLTAEGYHVLLAAEGGDAVRQVLSGEPDVVVLDIMLPGLDGFEVCQRLRALRQYLPIIMLTARDAISDRVTGLENGADDYLVKPFAFQELLARIRVRLRRPSSAPRVLYFADLQLDTMSREATRGERKVRSLTTTEYELLRYFLENPRQVLTRDQIYGRVWGYDFQGESKILEVYVRYLREKLEAGGEPRLLQTIRGAGYVLKEEA
jgi:two-component system response regulator MprA